MEILYRKDNDAAFCEAWRAYVAMYPASIRYALRMVDSYKAFSDNRVDDLSFIVLQDGKPVGLAFVPLEKLAGTLSVTLSGGYCPAPLAAGLKAEKFLYAHLAAAARQSGLSRIKFLIDAAPPRGSLRYNTLVKYGFLDTTTTNGLIDLRKESLRDGIRKGHWYDIQRMLKDPAFSVHRMDSANADYALHEEYRRLHHLCSGRVTRPKSTFDDQFELLKEDKAVLLGLKRGDRFIGFSYFFHSNNAGLYASSADDPEYADQQRLPIYHPILWTAMEYYKQRGFDWLELSTPCGYSPQWDDYLDDKQKNIASFKRGFGTEMVPLFRGILYLQEDAFLQDLATFKEHYLPHIAETRASAESSEAAAPPARE